MKIRARLQAFSEFGVEFFLCKFVPNVETVRKIGDEIIKPLRAR
jgi:hypothetical protein